MQQPGLARFTTRSPPVRPARTLGRRSGRCRPSCSGQLYSGSTYFSRQRRSWDEVLPGSKRPGRVNNLPERRASGGNTNEFVARGDQNLGSNTRLFGQIRLLLDCSICRSNPFGTGLCLDRCAEKYHTKLHRLRREPCFHSHHHSRCKLRRHPVRLSDGNPSFRAYDLTALGWPSTYNVPAKHDADSSYTGIPFPNDVGHSRATAPSAITTRNTTSRPPSL